MADPTGREADVELINKITQALELAFQAGRDSMKTEAAQAIEAEADRLEKLDKGPAVLVRKFAARFRDSK